MKIVFMTVAIMALAGGLAFLAVDKDVAIAVLVASATLAILGLAAQQEENHRELVELMERQPVSILLPHLFSPRRGVSGRPWL
jgi:hypothetical protein